jgi:two-component system LytT family sensor kinase
MKKLAVVSLHIAYWGMYLFVVSLMIAMMNMDNPPHFTVSQFLRVLAFSPLGQAAIIPGLIGFYSFYNVIFEKFLSQKKALKFIVASILVSITAAIATEIIMYFTPGNQASWTVGTCLGMGLFLAFVAFVNGMLGSVMKGFITWYGDIKVKVELNKKNHEMELELMKAQINPHFLFNTINNIDVLIQKDAVKASEYLNKLSDIMRFMLYEAKSEKIELTKELSYIEKYIELQRIRTTNPNYIQYEVKGNPANTLIEPMLFIPFIENAFKHAENKKVENAIQVKLSIDNNTIRFECENAYSNSLDIKPEHSGLGNELIKRRLELLYPKKHTFDVKNENGIYKITLVISI